MQTIPQSAAPDTEAPDIPALNRDDTLGLYLSVPFCRSKCTYCNFASGVYPASEHDRYVQRLIEELAESHVHGANLGLHLPQTVDSIYFGGGTPVLLTPGHFQAIFRAIRAAFTLAPDAEITIECAPGQLADPTLAALVECGMNRMSFGAQSFIDRECAVSGRLHTRADVLRDLVRLRAAGIANLNLDLLAGLAGQTLASWRESLNVLLDTGVPHASVYMLEIDEDSRLGRELLDGGARYHADLVPNDDTIATMYETAVEALSSAGLAQYEISNFARPGLSSRHNLRYWSRGPYLGVGLDAASMLFATGDAGDPMQPTSRIPPASLRWTRTADLRDYLDRDAVIAEQAWLSPAQQLEESWFLGLRRNSGVATADLARIFGQEVISTTIAVAHRLVEEGLLHHDHAEQRFTLTPRGRMLSNNVFAEFLALAEPHR